MKTIKIFTILTAFSCSVFSQEDRDRRGNNTLRDKVYEPEAIKVAHKSDSSENDQVDVSESDTGAQRPILLKKNGMSYFFGYDSKLFYQSNPFADSSALKTNIATGVWKSTFFSGAGLGVIDMDNFILTPYVGLSLSSTDYLKSVSLLNDSDYESTNAYILFLAQFGNGWSAKAGLSYSSDTDPLQGEVFKEFYPNISLMKTYSLGENYRGIFETGLGFHNSDINPSTADALPNDKRNLDAFISYSVDYTFKGITLTPKYKFTYRDYQNNDYKDRHDLVHALQFTCSTHITEFLKLSLSFDYINQDDSLGESSYENYDIGGNINLMARF